MNADPSSLEPPTSPTSISFATALHRVRSLRQQGALLAHLHELVTICDFFGEDLLTKTVLQFSGKRIANDPVQGQRPPGGNVVTPTIYKGAVFRLIDDYDANDLLQNVAEIKARTVVQRETAPTTRMSARIPLQPIDNAEQFAIALDQVA